jgi:hypothetical protein
MRALAAIVAFLCAATAQASVPTPAACDAWAFASGVIATMRDAGMTEADVALKILGDGEACKGADNCVVYDAGDKDGAGALVHAAFGSAGTPENIAGAVHKACMAVAVESVRS